MAFNYQAVLLGIFFVVIVLSSKILFVISTVLLTPDQEDLHYLAAWISTRRSLVFYVIAGIASSICNLAIVCAVASNRQRKRKSGSRFYVALFLLFPIIFLTAASITLSTLLPLSIDGCYLPETWPKVEGLTEVFEMIGATNGTNTPDDGCSGLQFEWYWGISILGVNVIECLVLLFFATFPPLITGTATFCYQWLSRKHNQQRKAAFSIAMSQLQRPKAAETATTTLLAQVLSNAKIIQSLAPHLHYNNILNLSLTSRTIHRAIFPSSSRNQAIETLRLASCQPGTKAACWSCGNQICATCTVTREMGKPASTHHLQNCAPYCSRCYHHCLCSRPIQDKETPQNTCLHMHQKPCHGDRESLIRPNAHRRHWWSRATSPSPPSPPPPPPPTVASEGSGSLVQRPLCQSCARLDAAAVIATLERRERSEMQSLARRLRCERCLRELDRGNKDDSEVNVWCWWWCGACLEPCWWDGHVGLDGGGSGQG